MANAAGQAAEAAILRAIAIAGPASIILATGTSQLLTLGYLVASTRIDWSKVVMFHLDEYIGLGEDHPAAFRRYLRDNFTSKVGALNAAHFIAGDSADPSAECRSLARIIRSHPIDVALVGIGENGHLAFNDPPADFRTEEPYIIVALDEPCRRQQVGEGWFDTLDAVPKRAISMSIRQIMKSRTIIASVPDARKAVAVRNALEGPVCNMCPASVLQQHPDCRIYLDAPAASLLALSSENRE